MIVVAETSVPLERQEMSHEPGIVTERVKDVIMNQTADPVVDGLWVHYTAKQWYILNTHSRASLYINCHHELISFRGLLGTTANERFHKFCNAKLKGIRQLSMQLFELYLLWLIEDWNTL